MSQRGNEKDKKKVPEPDLTSSEAKTFLQKVRDGRVKALKVPAGVHICLLTNVPYNMHIAKVQIMQPAQSTKSDQCLLHSATVLP